MAFFTFILYKSELLQIGTIWVVVDVAMKILLRLPILRNLQTTRGSSFTFSLLLNLLLWRYLLFFFFFLSNAKFSFAIFGKFVDFWRAFLAFFLCKSRIFLSLLFLLFLPYLLPSLITYRLFRGPSWPFPCLSLEFC